MINKKSYVKIEKEGMEAWLYLYEPHDGTECTKEEVIKFLKDNNIKYGYIESNIAAMCKKKIYEREVRVAVGQKGEEGHSGYYEYFFETDIRKLRKPIVLDNGAVDYRSVSLIQNVSAGDLIARYHPAEKGTDGMDVTGTPLRAPEVRDLLPLAGKGVERNQKKPNDYYATLDGRIEYDQDTNKISIAEVYYVNGNADLTNHPVVEFNGDIIIQGNVEGGVVVRAGKSLSIDGVVEAADIEAGGDIVVRRGILANNSGRVVSRGGDVIADFIEHGAVWAGGKVQANIIMNSHVICNEMVILEGRKGYIMGGYVHGRAGIKAVSIGNDTEIKSTVHVGCEPRDYEMRIELTQKMAALEDHLEDIINDMKNILQIKKKRPLTNLQKEQFIKLKEEKDALTERHKKMLKKSEKLQEIEMIAKSATIRVEGNLYAGTTIAIDNHELYIQRDTSFMEFSNEKGVIEGHVIVV